jgi:hypothetical protein
MVGIEKPVANPICTAHASSKVRQREVTNKYPLVIQRILSHFNSKSDDVVELMYHKEEHHIR